LSPTALASSGYEWPTEHDRRSIKNWRAILNNRITGVASADLTTRRRRGHRGLSLAGLLILGSWLCLALKAPALYWTEQPLPFGRIREAALRVGFVSDTMLLLGLMVVGYLVLIWLVELGDADLPATAVVLVSVAAGLGAFFTYAMFAEDVNFLLGNLWTFSFAGQNPYETSISEVPDHPFRRFTTWDALEFLYGPAVLLPGSVIIRLTGLNILNGVLAMKAVMLATFWLSGIAIYLIARALGSRKPVGLAALLLWNPLILADSVMTPHLDLAMAALVLFAALAWMHRREGAALLLLGLSVGVKLITALLVPVALLGLAISLRQRRWRGARSMAVALALLGLSVAALWPGVWDPLLENGVRKELDFDTIGALLPPLLATIQTIMPGLIPPEEDPWELAQLWRWVLFVPFWLAAIFLSGLLAWRMRQRLPSVLFLPLAMVLLGYHLIFTMVVLPWHFITVVCLSLASDSRVGRLSAAAITVSGLLYYLNDFWVWRLLADDHTARTLVMVLTLLSGPSLALCLMAAHTWFQARRDRGSYSAPDDPTRSPDSLASGRSTGVSMPLAAELPAFTSILARRYT
jgi:hypothetical protein